MLSKVQVASLAGAAAMGFGEKVWGREEGVQQKGGERCVQT